MNLFIEGKKIFVADKQMISNGYTRTGDVYLLDEEKVVKIYRYIDSNYNDYYKTKLDTLSKLTTNKFIKPLEIVYDKKGNIAGYTMKYIIGDNGDAILKCSTEFLINELEKIQEELTILSKNCVIIDDLIADNVKVNKDGMYFIDLDDYIIRTVLDYEKNIRDNNFFLNIFFKEIICRMYSYQKNELISDLFDDFASLYDEIIKFYKKNQTVESLVKNMVRSKEVKRLIKIK